MNKWSLIVSAALAIAAGTAQGAGDPEAGKQKSTACAACHGPDGNSVNPQWPKIAGQHASYIEKQLQAFKSGKRENELMSSQAQNLSEQDMADLAAYYASQTQTRGTAAADKVGLGQQLYRGGNPESGVAACIGCHGPAGAGNPPAVYPRVSGQHAAYAAKTLKDFRAGSRAGDPNRMMRAVAGKMTDAEIAAVAQYLQGLR